MDALVALFDAYGLALVFAVGFAEYAGLPIAAVPLLVTAGGISRMDGPALPLVVVCAALGGLLADALWYAIVRWRGMRLVDTACALSPNPNVCVLGVERRVARLGSRYILGAKFIPGAGNLIAAAAGLARFPLGRFLALDVAALLLWAAAYAGLGWIFAPQFEAVVRAVDTYTAWAIAIAVGLVIAGAGARLVKGRRHAGMHTAMGTADPDEERA